MYEDLKNYIQSIVKANGNEEITGTNMQGVLLQMVDIIGSPQFRGVASPVTNPGDPQGPVIYITASAGDYVHFGNSHVENGELALLKWDGAAWIKQTITTIVSNVFIKDSKDVSFIQHLMQLKGSQEQEITILAKANGIVVGGLVSWSGVGLTFNISFVIYLINNISFSIPAGTVTLDPADPDFKRTDVIGVNDQGAYVVLKGVADGLNLKPQVDASMLELTYVEIDAGAVIPSINELIIYNENIESVGTSALLTANFDDTTFPKVGVKDVKVTAVQNGGKLMFTLPAPEVVAPYNTLSLFLRLSQNIPTKGKLYAQFFKAGKAISDELPLTINSTLLNEYQFIAIAMTDFHFRSDSFDMFQLRYLGTNFNGFYLDYLRLEGGIVNPVPTGYSGWYLDAEATDVGVVRQMVRSGENVYFIGKNGLIINRYSHITKGNVIELELPDSVAASAYVYIAFASDDAGAGFTLVNNPSLAYCAILATDTELLNPVVGDFDGLWYKRLGVDGVDGITPHIGENGHWFLGLVDTGVSAQGPPGVGLPPGGTTGQVPKKLSNADYHIGWADDNGGGGGSTNLTAIPTVDKTASGITTDMVANEAQAFGDVVRINAAGKAQIAKGDVIANATALAMCVDETIEADAVGKYLLLGFVRNDAWEFTIGEWIYLSLVGTTGNTLTQVNPHDDPAVVEDNVIQMIGVANSADSFYFNPQLVQPEWQPSEV